MAAARQLACRKARSAADRAGSGAGGGGRLTRTLVAPQRFLVGQAHESPARQVDRRIEGGPFHNVVVIYALFPNIVLPVIHRRWRTLPGVFERRRRPSIAVHQNGTPLDVSDGSVAVRAAQRVVWAQSWTPRLLAGESVAEIGTRFDGDLLGESPAAAWDLAQQAAFAAAAGADLDRRLELVYGELSVWEYIEFQIAELTIHAWDLTRSIGVDDRLDDELAAAVFNRYKSDRLYGGVAPGVGWSAMFKEPVDVAAEADPQSRLVAYVGRDPQLH